MDVQSPLTGRCYYKVDVDALVLILIDAGIVTPLRAAQQTPAPQPPKVDTWAVALIGNATPVIILTRPSGETVRYGEDPDSAIKVFARIGAKLPQDVYEKYALQFPQSAAALMQSRKNAEEFAKARNAQAKHDGSNPARW